MDKKYLDVFERLGWTIHDYGDEYDIAKPSPAGEDFSFTTFPENPVAEVIEYANDFDVDDHIAMWIEAKRAGVSGVPSARELVEDAEAIKAMLKELADALLEVEGKRND
jgi:hypothetical protein